MRHFFQKNRLAVASVALALWFVGLNLCAFAVLARTDATSSGCPFCHAQNHSRPASSFCDKYNSQQTASCSLHAAIRFSAVSPAADFLAPGDRPPASFPPSLTGWDTTSPPGRLGFAELVLQESLFAQAPPAC